MAAVIGKEAQKPNSALEPASALLGTWSTTGTHPLVPGKTLHGRSSFAWLENGAFLIMRSEIDESEIPSGIGIIGTDEATGECSMLYFDERGVSRHYEMSFGDREWTWWRDASGFSQRMTGTFSPDGRTMTMRGEFSRDGVSWEADMTLTFTRAE